MPWTTPRTWVAGEYPTAAQMNAHLRDNLNQLVPAGPVWTSYTPTLTQGVALTKTVARARYFKIGTLVVATFSLDITSAGTAGQGIIVGLPVASVGLVTMPGSGHYYDAAPITRYIVGFDLATTTTAYLLHDTSGSGVFGSAPAITAASGDGVRGTIIYESAT